MTGGPAITYRDTKDVDIFQLAKLFEERGWADDTRDLGKLARVVNGSAIVASAWDSDRLVGFVRAISDGVCEAFVSKLTVLASHRRRGIGRELLRRLVAGYDDVAFYLVVPDAPPERLVATSYERTTDVFRRARKG